MFSTAKRAGPPRTIGRAEREDLTINSAIALKEMDSLFGLGGSPPAPAVSAPVVRFAEDVVHDPSPGDASFRPRAIFRDEA